MIDAMPMKKSITTLESEIRALDPWFQNIDLGRELRTKLAPCANEPLNHPQPTWEHIRPCLPSNLAGKSVLDVGCNAGFYCFESKRLGAARVLGIDSQRREIAQARLAAGILGLDVSFMRRSVYDLSIADIGCFDLVFALGLLYHCRHPLLALEHLAEVTHGTLILESAVAPPRWTVAPETSLLGGLARPLTSAFFLENGPDEKEAVFNWFLPTASCLAALLRSAGFTNVRHVPISETRAIFLAERGLETALDASSMSYQARFASSTTALSVTKSAPLTLTVSVWNIGTAPWAASSGHEGELDAVFLGVHLLDANDNVLEWDFRRCRLPLPGILHPGGRFDFSVVLTAPDSPGTYFLEFDLVRESDAWFEELGGTPLTVNLAVVAA